MAIIRTKRSKHFTVLDNGIFKTGGLAWDSRGLLCTLLSKSDDWKVIVKQLEKETAGTRKHTKERGIREMMAELIAAGYVVCKKRQSGHMDYFVYDTPQTAEMANCGNGKLRKPQTAETANCEKSNVLINTENYKKEKIKDNKEQRCSGANATASPADTVNFADNDDWGDDNSEPANREAEGGLSEPTDTDMPPENLTFANLPAEPKPAKTAKDKAVGITAATWAAYRAAYLQVYGCEPLRNAKVNGQISQFVKLVGADKAPHIAAFFVHHPNHWYRTKGHDFGTLLANAQAVAVDWQRNMKTTSVETKRQEQTAANMSAAQRLIEKYEREAV